GFAPDAVTFEGAPSPSAVLDALARGAAELAVLPIANTTGGLVRASIDAIGAGELELAGEVALPVRFTLWARAGVALEEIERVASHPQAFAQCARFLERTLPGRARVAWSDTASAARDLANGTLDPRTAVLASWRAGELSHLTPLARDAQDEADNRTFFAVLRR